MPGIQYNLSLTETQSSLSCEGAEKYCRQDKMRTSPSYLFQAVPLRMNAWIGENTQVNWVSLFSVFTP